MMLKNRIPDYRPMFFGLYLPVLYRRPIANVISRFRYTLHQSTGDKVLVAILYCADAGSILLPELADRWQLMSRLKNPFPDIFFDDGRKCLILICAHLYR